MSIHPNIKRTWIEHEIIDKEHKTVLVIETDLETRPDHPDFNSSTFDDMVNAAAQKMEKAPSVIGGIRVIPQGIK